MMTLVATPPNLIVHGELQRHGLEGFAFFSFSPFGLPLLALAILYMLAVRPFLTRKGGSQNLIKKPRLTNWIQEYALDKRQARIRVLPHSDMIGKTLEELNLRETAKVNVLAIERQGRFSRKIKTPFAKTQIMPNDILLLDVFEELESVAKLAEDRRLEILPLSSRFYVNRSQELGMAEAIIPDGSGLIGKTIINAHFRSSYNLAVIGLKRETKAVESIIIEEKLKLGDTLLILGPWRAIRRIQNERNELVLLNLPAEMDEVVPQPSRAIHALAILALVVFLMVTDFVPNVLAALIGCLLMGLFRCIDTNAAYRSIHWQSLILIIGMLPFSLALQKTGGVSLASDFLVTLCGNQSPRIILASLFTVTALLGLFISNTATAVLMAPVALSLSQTIGTSPYPFMMTVALAASAAFMTPVSSPVNTLVIGPGGYQFFDFVKIGVPFAFITMIVSVFLVPLLLPF